MKPIDHIAFKKSGKPIVTGTRIAVEFLALLLNNPEWPMERICDEFPLTPAQVYAAWSYYYDHKANIDRRIEEESRPIKRPDEAEHGAKIEAMKHRYEEKHGHSISEVYGEEAATETIE